MRVALARGLHARIVRCVPPNVYAWTQVQPYGTSFTDVLFAHVLRLPLFSERLEALEPILSGNDLHRASPLTRHEFLGMNCGIADHM